MVKKSGPVIKGKELISNLSPESKAKADKLNHVGLVIKAALVQPSLVQDLPQMAVFEVSRRSSCTRLGATLNLLTVRTHKHVVVRFPLW